MDTPENQTIISLSLRLLKWFCPAHLYEEIEGDLIQRFERDAREVGELNAKRRFIWNTLRFFRPGILLRNKFSFEFNQFYMIRTYFVMAYRQIMRGKVFSIINVLGLSVGITAFFLIIQYVSFEMSYDQLTDESHEVYRVAYQQFENGELKNTSAKNFVGLRNLMKEHFPEIESFTGLSPIPANINLVFGYKGKIYFEKGRDIRTDSAFFKVFPSLLQKGNPSTVLNNGHSIVISESLGKKIFGDADPVGQQLDNLHDDSGVPDLITGVFKDLPENSHFHAGFITSLQRYAGWDAPPNYWNGPDFYTYFKVKRGTNPKTIEERLNSLLDKLEKDNPKIRGTHVFFQSIESIHLDSNVRDELEANGNKAIVYGLAIIGLLILMMAWINYLNMETARFMRRAREVGVRRIIGSDKSDLAIQFLIEYLCINILSAVVALLMLQLLLPNFSYLTGISISQVKLISPVIWLMAIACFVVGSVVVGIYPALFLLKLNPVASLKGNFGSSQKGTTVKRILITIQFTSSLALIAFLLVIYQQLNYLMVTNKKIDLVKVIAVENPTAYTSKADTMNYYEYQRFANRLLENPSFKMVSASSALPGTEIGFTFINQLKRNMSEPYNPTRFKVLFADYNFIPLYGLKLKSGRNYSIADGDEENWTTVIINESAARAIGFASAEEAVGQVVNFLMWKDDYEKYKIIGVVEDYHHEALKKEINPTIISLNHNKFQQVFYSIKLNEGSNSQEAVAFIEKSWKELFPEKPFDYFFIDDFYDRQFKSELHIGRVFSLFAGIAVFIACLGILGMTLFEANARLKEISIRKVLGATLSNLVTLLSKSYFRLILVSMFLSIPVIYYCATAWLNNYPQRIELNGWFYFVPLLVIVILVTLVSLVQIVKAAGTNPVDNLKYE